MSARLTAYLPDGAAAECLLRAPSPLRIGRSGECRLVLDHASVSRLHADLEYGQGDWRLRDLDSKNGTFVDGVRIVAQALSGPSWLRFGDVTCQFQPLDATALARAEQRISARHSASLVHTLRVEQQKTLPDLLQATLTAVVELAGCERGFLLVDGSDGLSVRAWHGLQASTLGSPGFGGSVGAVQRALRERAPVIVNDLGNDAQLGARASVIAGGLRTLYEKPVGTLALDGPCAAETTGFEFKEDATNGLLPQPFTLPAGPYAIRMELVRTDTNTVVETVVTYGNVRTTVGPDMLFTAAVLTAAAGDDDASRTAQPLTAAAGRLAEETGLHVPDYFPIAPNSVLATARDSFHDLREPFVRVIEATLDEPDLVKVLKAIREQALVAELNALYVGSAWLGGFDRVVVVLQENDFILSGMDGAVAFAPSQKVVFILPTGNHWDVAHEVVHTLPHLWSEDEMAAACGVNYHNWGRFGNGHRIILGGAENRARKERYPGLMGAATREADYWIEQCTYWHLLNQLVAIPDPELLAVRGLLYQGDDGKRLGAFLPSYTLMGEPDLTEGTGGDYALVVTDAAGKRLGRFPFNPRFRYSESEEDVNLISFGYRIPRPAGAAGIELHGPAGVLVREAISPNAPSVTISAPAAGAEVAPGPKGIAVTWSATDPDGDTLTYALLYSPDGGKRWVDAVPFPTQTSANVPVGLLAAGGQHLFRVVASDGFNSTEVTMAAPFKLKGEEPGAPALTIRLPIDSPTATVNGQTVTLDAPAMIVENRTLVPLRFVSEALGAEVGWNGETRQITVKLESNTVELWLDQTRAVVNGEERTLDVPPLIVNGRSLVPIRFVAEALQAKVEWEPESRTVIITR